MREIKFEFLYRGMPYSSANPERPWFKKTYSLDELIEKPLNKLSDVHSFSELVAKRQYTGLKDKNGVEIYEGDIVMCYPDEINLCYTKVVEWDNERPSLGITTNGRSGATLCKNNQDILWVIGNVHQNPELLEKQQ